MCSSHGRCRLKHHRNAHCADLRCLLLSAALTHLCTEHCLAAGTHVQGPGEPSPLDQFWSAVAEQLADALRRAVSKRSAVRDALTHGFPRLQALVEASLVRCARDSEVPSVPSAVQLPHRDAVLRCLSPLQEAYLSHCVARLEEAVSALYPAGGRAVPAVAVVQQCIACGPLPPCLSSCADTLCTCPCQCLIEACKSWAAPHAQQHDSLQLLCNPLHACTRAAPSVGYGRALLP